MSDDVEAGTEGVEGEQLSLLGPRVPRHRRAATVPGIADVDPVAVVQVDTGLAHLDRPFDYLVPADLADQVASPGGATREGLNVLDADKALGRLMQRTLTAAAERSAGMAAAARG